MHRPLLALTLASLACLTLRATAQPVLITAPQTLNPGATTITPTAGGAPIPLATADITVRGTTLTVNGKHTIRNLVIENNGVVTHTQGFTYDSDPITPGTQEAFGMWLEVVPNPMGGDVVVGAGSRIDVSVRGYAPGTGPGAGLWNGNGGCGSSGAGHGGIGGISGCQAGGTAYGSITQPSTMGSGSGRYSNDNNPAGSGGGAVRLTVNGVLTLNGSIVANGGSASNQGGGAGGSVWIDAGSITGAGSVTAWGGNSGDNNSNWGSGGGGRIAMYYTDSLTLPLNQVQTWSGSFGNRGGAGTIFIKRNSEPFGDLRVLNDTVRVAETPVDNASDFNEIVVGAGGVFAPIAVVNARAVTVNAGGVVTHFRGQELGVNLSVSEDFTIEAGGAIDVSARGYTPGNGPGAGLWNGNGGCGSSGAGHGGIGGISGCQAGGTAYGSITQPSTMGSGSGRYSNNNNPAGSGGGTVRLTVNGVLTVNGSIVANGGSVGDQGGGSGGSVWIEAGSITGAGSVTAWGGNSGASNSNWGSGAGGRIAMYYTDSLTLPLNQVQTWSGSFGNRGGAGTIFIKRNSEPFGDLRVLNDTVRVAETRVDNASDFNEIVVGAGGVFAPIAVVNARAVTVNSGGVVTHFRGQELGVNLSVSEDFTIEAGGAIDVSARGYAPGTGPGAGLWNGNGNCGSSGAGHGGIGGVSGCQAGGAVYGSITQPSTMGSGGGRYSNAYDLASSGGGVIRLSIGGVLNINGSIIANGGSVAQHGSAGGSVWIDAGSITGSGTLTANGGNPRDSNSNWGSGGGGRIAIYSCNVTTPLTSFRVDSGLNGNRGQPGTLYFGSSSINITQQPIGGDYRGGDFFQLGVQANSPNGELTYQWRKKNEAGEFIPLTEGQGGGVFTNVTGPTLFVSGVSCDGGGDYDCLICDSCGCFPSNIANLNVQSIADFNNDGGIDGSDIEAFFTSWESGNASSDVNLDGGIDGSDVELFFLRWEGGC